MKFKSIQFGLLFYKNIKRLIGKYLINREYSRLNDVLRSEEVYNGCCFFKIEYKNIINGWMIK